MWRLVACALLAVGCGKSTDPGSEPGPDASAEPDGSVDCTRAPAPADRDRFAVIAHPYDDGGGPGQTWEVLRLTRDGDLSTTGTTFEMGRATNGRIAFTPDGAIGVVAQEDGTVGVFQIDEDGGVEVIDPAFDGGFYAASIQMDPSGARAYVLDTQWRENGGGVYALAIDCDSNLIAEGQWVSAKLPAALLWMSEGRAILAADDAMTSPAAQDVHLLSWSSQPSWMAGASVFPDDEAIVSDAALSFDGRFALVADNAAFSGIPNRIGIAEITGAGDLEPAGVLSPIEDPYSLAMSPFDRGGIAVSGFGDAIVEIEYDNGYSLTGELAYAGAKPQLPGSAVVIDRGPLAGRVLVAENVAVRQLQFQQAGGVEDLGPTSTGEGLEAIVGAIGVQP